MHARSILPQGRPGNQQHQADVYACHPLGCPDYATPAAHLTGLPTSCSKFMNIRECHTLRLAWRLAMRHRWGLLYNLSEGNSGDSSVMSIMTQATLQTALQACCRLARGPLINLPI